MRYIIYSIITFIAELSIMVLEMIKISDPQIEAVIILSSIIVSSFIITTFMYYFKLCEFYEKGLKMEEYILNKSLKVFLNINYIISLILILGGYIIAIKYMDLTFNSNKLLLVLMLPISIILFKQLSVIHTVYFNHKIVEIKKRYLW